MEATGNDLSLVSLSMNDIIRSLPVKNLSLMVSFKFRERSLKKNSYTQGGWMMIKQ